MAYPKGTKRPPETTLKMSRNWYSKRRKRRQEGKGGGVISIRCDAEELQRAMDESSKARMNTSAYVKSIFFLGLDGLLQKEDKDAN